MTLSKCEQFGYGEGHLFSDLCSAFWFTYSLIFYQAVLKFSSVYSGAIMLIGQAADALATPLVGGLSDRTSLFVEYGKFKLWHLSGTVGIFLTLPFMYSPCFMCEFSEDWKRIIYYSIFIVLFQLAWAAVQIAHLALAPVLTDDPIERTYLFSLRNSFTFLASILVYAITWAVLGMQEDSERLRRNDVYKFQAIVFTLCVIGAATTLIFHMVVNENTRKSLQPKDSGSLNSISRLNFKELFSKCLLYQAAIIYTSARVFCNVSQSLINLYLHEYLKLSKQNIAIIPFVIFSSSFLSSWVTTQMNQHLGRKMSLITGCVIGLAACVWIWFGEGYVYNTYCIYGVGCLLGVSYSVQMVTSLAVTTDLIGKDIGNSAFIFGAMSFSEKLCCGLLIFLVQSLAPDYHEESECCVYYRNAIVLVCGVAAITGSICILTIKGSYRN